MRRSLVLAGLTMTVASALAQVPVGELAKPPRRGAAFRHPQSTGGKHGDSWTWVAPDGARMGRESRIRDQQIDRFRGLTGKVTACASG